MASKSKKSSALRHARERIYRNLLKRSWRLAPDPVPVRATAVSALPPKRAITRAPAARAILRGRSAASLSQTRAWGILQL